MSYTDEFGSNGGPYNAVVTAILREFAMNDGVGPFISHNGISSPLTSPDLPTVEVVRHLRGVIKRASDAEQAAAENA